MRHSSRQCTKLGCRTHRPFPAQRQQPGRSAETSTVDSVEAQKQAGVLKLVTAYRSRGHLAAQLDPLNLAATYDDEKLKALGLLP